MAKYRDMAERLFFLSVLDLVTGCWIWIGRRDSEGYGLMTVRRPGVKHPVVVRAHRVSYEELTGHTIPDAFHVDHRCNNPSCINPGHLKAVPYWENLNRRTWRKR